jgi:hypothetical protein
MANRAAIWAGIPGDFKLFYFYLTHRLLKCCHTLADLRYIKNFECILAPGFFPG